MPLGGMVAVQEQKPVAVSLLALPESTPGALYGLLEVFSAVGVAWTELTGEPVTARRMQTRIVAAETQPFATAVGPVIAPDHGLTDDTVADLVLVTDLALPMPVGTRGRWPRETRWAREQYRRGATVCSVCTGSLFLAEAGLLDGREATTHWGAVDLFRTGYPRVRLRPELILCESDPDGRLITGGGAAAWEDLALHLIARFCGTAEAVRIAKVFLLGDRSEGQLPFTAMPRRAQHDDPVIGACQAWIAEHYSGPNPVARMVRQSGLAERTFKRRFKAATGYAPVDYVQAVRIEEAKQMLETSDEPTDAVASAVGYEDPAFFRRLFRRRTGLSPARYRQRFRPIARRRR
ncbi:MAG: helix-turn-helix domain-containing protein [Thalassobaculum sp.]|uniref:GlxA family transcriptional regulator n=1 Tax=Thalassobaculum sp. TaxID=2022740 RepID=UPI0032EF490D